MQNATDVNYDNTTTSAMPECGAVAGAANYSPSKLVGSSSFGSASFDIRLRELVAQLMATGYKDEIPEDSSPSEYILKNMPTSVEVNACLMAELFQGEDISQNTADLPTLGERTANPSTTPK